MNYIFVIGEDRAVRYNYFLKVYSVIEEILKAQEIELAGIDSAPKITFGRIEEIKKGFVNQAKQDNPNRLFATSFTTSYRSNFGEMLEQYEALQELLNDSYKEAEDAEKKEAFKRALLHDKLRCAELAYKNTDSSLEVVGSQNNMTRILPISDAKDKGNHTIILHGSEGNNTILKAFKRQTDEHGKADDIKPNHIATFLRKCVFSLPSNIAIPQERVELLVCCSHYAGLELAFLLPEVNKIICSTTQTKFVLDDPLLMAAVAMSKITYLKQQDNLFPELKAADNAEIEAAYRDAKLGTRGEYTDVAMYNTFCDILKELRVQQNDISTMQPS